MFKFLRKHRTVLMVTLAACIIGLPFFGIGTSFLASPQDTIAKVNGTKLKKHQFDQLYNQLIRQRSDMTAEQRSKLPGEVLNELIRQEVFYQEAKRYGIRVTDQEVQVYLASLPAFQREGKFDPRLYYQTVIQVFGLSPKEFEDQRKRDIVGRKLNRLIAASVQVDEGLVQASIKRRIASETDPKKKKELRENPDIVRQELKNQEINLVFGDWLNQLNSKLKVRIVSENFRKRLAGTL